MKQAPHKTFVRKKKFNLAKCSTTQSVFSPSANTAFLTPMCFDNWATTRSV